MENIVLVALFRRRRRHGQLCSSNDENAGLTSWIGITFDVCALMSNEHWLSKPRPGKLSGHVTSISSCSDPMHKPVFFFGTLFYSKLDFNFLGTFLLTSLPDPHAIHGWIRSIRCLKLQFDPNCTWHLLLNLELSKYLLQIICFYREHHIQKNSWWILMLASRASPIESLAFDLWETPHHVNCFPKRVLMLFVVW
jgi:hypothetical protein